MTWQVGQWFGFGQPNAVSLGRPFSATGGTTTDSGGYRYHAYPFASFPPATGPHTLDMAGVSGEPVLDTTIEVMCTGGGGGGAGGKPGGSNQDGGQGGGGGATGSWEIPITAVYQFAIETGNDGEGGPAGTNGSAGGDSSFSTPTFSVTAAGGEQGIKYPNQSPTTGEGGSNTNSWPGASISENYDGENGQPGGANESGNGGGSGSFGSWQPGAPTKWWYPFSSPGAGSNGRNHGDPSKPASASFAGGGAAGGQAGFDGGTAGPGGDGAAGVVVIRYEYP